MNLRVLRWPITRGKQKLDISLGVRWGFRHGKTGQSSNQAADKLAVLRFEQDAACTGDRPFTGQRQFQRKSDLFFGSTRLVATDDPLPAKPGIVLNTSGIVRTPHRKHVDDDARFGMRRSRWLF